VLGQGFFSDMIFFLFRQAPAFTPPAPITTPLFNSGQQQQQQQQPSPGGMFPKL